MGEHWYKIIGCLLHLGQSKIVSWFGTEQDTCCCWVLLCFFLQPLLSLKPDELKKLLPLMTKISTPKLAGLFQALAGDSDSSFNNTLLLLRGVRGQTLWR
jgi:hypothetical protein